MATSKQFKQLLRANLNVEVYKIKDDITAFGIVHQKSSIILDQNSNLLYIALTSIFPYDTIISLNLQNKLSLIGGGNLQGDVMYKGIYDTNNSGIVDEAEGLISSSGIITGDEITKHIDDRVNDRDWSNAHNLDAKANLHGDNRNLFEVSIGVNAYDAINMTQYSFIRKGSVNLPDTADFFLKGFWSISLSGYPMSGLVSEQAGWYWIVDTAGNDLSGKSWAVGDWAVYTGIGSGTNDFSWVRISAALASPDTSTGLKLFGEGWFFYNENIVNKIGIGSDATDMSFVTDSDLNGRVGASGARAYVIGENNLSSGDNTFTSGKTNTTSGDNSATIGGKGLTNDVDNTLMTPLLNIGSSEFIPPDGSLQPPNNDGIFDNKIIVRSSSVGNEGKLLTIEDTRNWSEPTVTSLISGGIASRVDGINSTEVFIPEGTGQIINVWDNTSIPASWVIPKKTFVKWNDTTVDISSYMESSSGVIVIYIDEFGDNHMQTGKLTNSQRRKNIILAYVYYINPTGNDIEKDITAVITIPIVSNNTTGTILDLISYLPDRTKIKGILIQPVTNPVNKLSIWQSRGSTFGVGINWALSTTNPNVVDIPQAGDADFNSSVSPPLTFTVVLADGTIAIDPSNPGTPLINQTDIPKIYEPNGAGTVVPLNQSTTNPEEAVVQYFFRNFGSTFYLQLGQQVYTNGRDARNNVKSDEQTHIFYPTADQSWFLAQLYLGDDSVNFFSDIDKAGIVNSSGDISQGANAITSFINLDDVPLTYIGSSKYSVTVSEDQTNLLFEKKNRIYEWVQQAGHGFIEGTQIFKDAAGIWQKAIADSSSSIKQAFKFAYVHLTGLNDNDTFEVVYEGIQEIAHIWTIGEIYYLSDETAGETLIAAPTHPSSFIQKCFKVIDANHILILNDYPHAVTGNGTRSSILVNQSAHGFNEFEFIYYNSISSLWELAQANDKATLMEAMVFNPSADSFEAIFEGTFIGSALSPTSHISWLSADTPGAVVDIQPTERNTYAQAVVNILDDDTYMVLSQAVDDNGQLITFI